MQLAGTCTGHRCLRAAPRSCRYLVPGTWYLVEASRSDTCPATQAWQQVPRGAAGSCRQARLILTLNFYFYSSTHYYYYYYYYYYYTIIIIIIIIIYVYILYTLILYYYLLLLYNISILLYIILYSYTNIFLQYIAIILQLFCCNNILQY